MTSLLSYRWCCKIKRRLSFGAMLCSWLFIFLMVVVPAHSQITDNFNADEISVDFSIPRVAGKEIPALLKGQKLYLSFTELFNFLQLKNSVSQNMDSISGFVIHPLSTFVVDRHNDRIIYDGVTYNLRRGELIRTETDIYLQSEEFGTIFGLQCDFNFRTLTVILNTQLELPVLKEMKLQLVRKNLKKLKNEVKPDTIIAKSKKFLSLGMMDWVLSGLQYSSGMSSHRIDMNIGARLAGGELQAAIVASDNKFINNASQPYFRWKLVNNKSKVLRQLTVGKVQTQTLSSLFGPITGFQVSNSPTFWRKSFGTYRLTQNIEPNWTVELYINNVLIDYTKSDASGFFSFDVPLMYGNTFVTLKAYGPYGEERIKEETIQIPFNFLPQNEFEYTLTTGVVNDKQQSKFSRLNFNYGFTKRITIGSGVEYLSSVEPSKVLPFINASVRLGEKAMVSAEHASGVRSKAFFTYKLPKSLLFEATYLKYTPGQRAVNVSYLEERKVGLSYLYNIDNISGFSRLSVSQLKFPKFTNTLAEWVLSANYKFISSNITTTAMLYAGSKNINSNLYLNFRLPHGITFTPQFRYDYTEKEFIQVRFDLEKRMIKNAVATLSYQNSGGIVGNSVSVGFRYNFSFMQLAVSAVKNKHGYMTSQNARGSMLFNDVDNKISFRPQANVGRGAVTLLPFVDLNDNGKRDAGEPRAFGLQVKTRGGKVERNEKDSTVSITGLEPYTDFLIELKKTSFDNIAWQIKKTAILINVEPNHFKLVEVPITVMGEVSGMVYLQDVQQNKAGQGRIIVNIFKDDTTLVAKTLSEPDGYFSYLGLPPGQYSIMIDEAQMAKLNFCCPEKKAFDINADMQGDMVSGIEFLIKSIVQPPMRQKVVVNDSADVGRTTQLTDHAIRIQKTKTANVVDGTKRVDDKKSTVKKATSTRKVSSTKSRKAATVASKTTTTSGKPDISSAKDKMLPGEWEKFIEFMKSLLVKDYAAALLLWFTLHH